ncbi:CPBP family intramembrane glutamic endopeptidase [Bacillus sp. Marseille-Q3570]|uniref:CPBP family intramembrane glutamic endopeptidase n=1 Tax=Bacillus sp. Marseille-Q3570 TaxID=2963522 RepID=UPI0021B735D5|nr:type II CAAX endopeptidase family protein [Bacillus sp. Marseille-Q3570]
MTRNTSVFLSVLMAWIGLGAAFQASESFWVFFPLVQAGLLIFSILKGKISWNGLSIKNVLVAVGSGVFIYCFFAVGKLLVTLSIPSLFIQLENLYTMISPETWWHTLLVFVIIIPAEEWFWRGYVQNRLHGTARFRVIVSVLLYGGAHLGSGSILLVLAAVFAGFAWAILYEKTKNIWLPLLSHLVFDLLLFMLFPLL